MPRSFRTAVTRLAFTAALAFAAVPVHAQSLDEVKTAFAKQVYATAGSQVHNERPQALLRAVVVLRVKLDEQGRWAAEVFRDNDTQPELTQVALASVAKLPPPTDLKPEAVDALKSNGMIEAWLFQKDGRFALKTLAKPQKGA